MATSRNDQDGAGRTPNLIPISRPPSFCPGSRPSPPGPPPRFDQGSSHLPPGAILEDESNPVTDSLSDSAFDFSSDDRLAAAAGLLKPFDTRFWLGTRYVSATGSPIDGIHAHVFRLRLRYSLTATLIGALASLLPRKAWEWAKTRWPEWFLPRTLIFKKRKEGWDDEFANETRMYANLKALQGAVVPVCYGQVTCDDAPALLLSDTGGSELCHPDAGGVPMDRLAKLLRDALEAPACYHVSHGDIKLDKLQPGWWHQW